MGVKARLSLASAFALLADGIGALLLTIYAILLGPLGILRGPLVLERFFWYAWVLTPLGVLTCIVRAVLDWRLGNFPIAIIQMEGIIDCLVQSYLKRPTPSKRRVLVDLFTLLTRAYLHIGQIDKAMQVILQAQKSIGAERLPGLSESDAKTAHLIRAGIAAGRLLDGGGLATMFIKSDARHPLAPENVIPPQMKPGQPSKEARASEKVKARKKEAKIIPFRVSRNPHGKI
ncbi:MAG: hypothetical protein HYW48_02340 [Deltaproteobacteria bacterium]|nr:hypothetical protein [Deltaproteobacteria bacterium]